MLALARKLSPRRPARRLLSLPTAASPSPRPAQTQTHANHNPCQNPSEFLLPLLFALPRPFSSPPKAQPPAPPPPPPLLPLDLLRGGCYDEARQAPPPLPLCPGCGVHMQDTDPALPGFFSTPSPKSPAYHAPLRRTPAAGDEPHISHSLKTGRIREEAAATPAEEGWEPVDPKPVVCARCHTLRHYGRVKNAAAENLLPDFDFDRMVAPKMVSASGTRSVVLMVVDAADFDGSFPRKVARLVSASVEANASAWKEGKPGNVPRVLLVVTKIDLLPSSLSPTGLEYWVRQRAHEGGAGRITGVHLVSSLRDWGVRNLVDDVRRLAGLRGNVWAVGAQNAGKSTLINAMGRGAGGKVSHLTEAPVPGTTLGIVRVEGILGGQAKLFDTPGILHPHQISVRLTAEEQKVVHISKELRPRTYRIKAGHSVHIAGLMRLDVEELSVDTIYLTVWASPLLPLHMGKIENACTMMETHFGRQLQPPIGENRVSQLGNWVRRKFSVSGNSWDVSSVDIAAAGLGWFAVGLKGKAILSAWTYEGVDVILRNSLIPDRAKIFEVTGFTVSKIVSQADSASNKRKHSRKAKMLADVTVSSDVEPSVTANAELTNQTMATSANCIGQ